MCRTGREATRGRCLPPRSTVSGSKIAAGRVFPLAGRCVRWARRSVTFGSHASAPSALEPWATAGSHAGASMKNIDRLLMWPVLILVPVLEMFDPPGGSEPMTARDGTPAGAAELERGHDRWVRRWTGWSGVAGAALLAVSPLTSSPANRRR